MPTPQPTLDELLAALKRSHLPSIVVEGDDDMQIYRWIEDRLGSRNANILPCGGRSTLLSLYDRRNEFAHLKTAFVADRDMWLFSAIPAHYANIVWTEGYSIENDLYAGANLENLLDQAEALEHRQVLLNLIEWFAFEVEEYRQGNEPQIAVHPNSIIPPGSVNICHPYITQRGYRKAQDSTIQEIEVDYKLKLRGKILFQLLARYLNAPRRRAKHSIRGLHEVALRIQDPHIFIDRIVADVRRALS